MLAEVAVPSVFDQLRVRRHEQVPWNTPTAGVVIGMDPHRRSVTIEGMTADEFVVDRGRYGTDETGFTALLDQARRWPVRV